MTDFTNREILRYSRHLIMPEFGVQAQARLKEGRVLLVGTGGLGSPCAMYLAAAGLGTLGLVDFDVVDETNLQRQVIHGTRDVGRPKLASARETLLDINPFVTIHTYEVPFTSQTAMDIIRDQDYLVIIDGTDNFPTRYLVNDVCVLMGKVNVYGSIFRFEGQAAVFDARQGPCYRCLYPEPPPPGLVPSCAEGGVLGVLPGVIGTIQATEAIKVIAGIGEPLIGSLLLYDALAMEFRKVRLRKNPDCPLCGEHPTLRQLSDYEQFCGVPIPSRAEEQAEVSEGEISPQDLAAILQSGREPIRLIDVREPHEYEICRLEGAELMPLSRLAEHLNRLGREENLVLYCRSGQRSRKALEMLRRMGFRKVRNLTGGINAWAEKVDPSLPRY